MEDNFKIYVVCHKEAFVPQSQYLIPIQVGCENADTMLENYVHDNTGDNISYKNPDYCELTATYWMWKNDHSSYIGLFHYRRYLALDEKNLKKYMNHWKQIYYMGALTQKTFDGLGFNDETKIRTIQEYDLIIPKCSELHYKNIKNFYELYKRGDQNVELDYALKKLVDKYPEYQDAVEECKTSAKGYHYNMFIMRREVFNEYCEWLFSVLDSMYDDMKSGVFVTKKTRMIGYMAEFMMGVFVCKKRNELKIKEVPAVYFNYTDGKSHFFWIHICNAIRRFYRLFFPVGSKREFYLFKVVDSMRY